LLGVDEHLRTIKRADLVRICVGVDPAASSGDDANETGIIVAGKGVDGFGYVLADRSCRLSPDGWARRAIRAYQEFHADRIVAESNQGGEMVAAVLRTVDRNIPVKLIHASKGKYVRAEPISALYEQGRVFHCGDLSELEDQLCTWTLESGESPDRLDALCHVMHELFPSKGGLRVW
jgi:predicted phage terminase large subunit-like protein